LQVVVTSPVSFIFLGWRMRNRHHLAAFLLCHSAEFKNRSYTRPESQSAFVSPVCSRWASVPAFSIAAMSAAMILSKKRLAEILLDRGGLNWNASPFLCPAVGRFVAGRAAEPMTYKEIAMLLRNGRTSIHHE